MFENFEKNTSSNVKLLFELPSLLWILAFPYSLGPAVTAEMVNSVR